MQHHRNPRVHHLRHRNPRVHHLRLGSSELNYAIYRDRYQRTGDGWKFTERRYEIRYHDQSPLAGPGSGPS